MPIIIIGDTYCNPSILDNILYEGDEYFDALSDFPYSVPAPLFDLQGNYRHPHVVYNININSAELEDGMLPNTPCYFEVFEGICNSADRETTLKEPDCSSCTPHFAWQSINIIKWIAATTQCA